MRNNNFGLNTLRGTGRLIPTVRIENNKGYFDKSLEASPEGNGFKSRAEINREKIVENIEWFGKPCTSILSFFMETVDDLQLKEVTDNVTQYIEQYVSLKNENTAIMDVFAEKVQRDPNDEDKELKDLSELKGFEIYKDLDFSIRKNNVAFDTAKALYILGDVLFNRTDQNGLTGINHLINNGFLSEQETAFLKNVGLGQSPLYARGAILLGYIDILHTLLNIMSREYVKNKQDDQRFNDIPRIARETIMEPEKSDDIVTCQMRIKNIWKNSGLLPQGFDVDSIGSAENIPIQKIRSAFWSKDSQHHQEMARRGEWKEPASPFVDNRFGKSMVFDAQNNVADTNYKFNDKPHPFADIKTPNAYRPGIDGDRTKMPPRGTVISRAHFNWDWKPKDPQLMLYTLDNGNEIIFDPMNQRWEEQKFENQMRSFPKYNHSNAPQNRKEPTGIPAGYRQEKISRQSITPAMQARNLAKMPFYEAMKYTQGGGNSQSGKYSPFRDRGPAGPQEVRDDEGRYGYAGGSSGVYNSSQSSSRGPVPVIDNSAGVVPNYNLKTNYVQGTTYNIDGIRGIYVIGDIFFDVNNRMYCNERGVYFDKQDEVRYILLQNNIISQNEYYPTPRVVNNRNDNLTRTSSYNTSNNQYRNSYNTMGEFRYTEPERNDDIVWSTADNPVIQNKTIHLKGVFS